jgi:hypothetical protein
MPECYRLFASIGDSKGNMPQGPAKMSHLQITWL